MRLNKKKLVLFDMDGVLIDSKPNMELAWKNVCQELDIDIPFEIYFSNIGRPFKDILNIIGIIENQDLVKDIYDEASLQKIGEIDLFEGVNEYLKFLISQDIKLGIITSKSKIRVMPILKKFDVNFSIIRTPDKVCRGKPAPDHLLMAIAKLNVDPIDSIFIDDMHVDYIAAKRANIDYLHASWGYGDGIENAKVLTNITEMSQYIFGGDK